MSNRTALHLGSQEDDVVRRSEGARTARAGAVRRSASAASQEPRVFPPPRIIAENESASNPLRRRRIGWTREQLVRQWCIVAVVVIITFTAVCILGQHLSRVALPPVQRPKPDPAAASLEGRRAAPERETKATLGKPADVGIR